MTLREMITHGAIVTIGKEEETFFWKLYYKGSLVSSVRPFSTYNECVSDLQRFAEKLINDKEVGK